VPLEVDHGRYYSTGKVSDPASLGLHERSFAVTLPFQRRTTVAAGQDEVYLGHPEAKAYLRINTQLLTLELEVGGDGAKLKIGAGATRGGARLDDEVTTSAAFNTWKDAVTAATAVPPMLGTLIGKISTASGKVDIE
jgi:hypothetical protein